MKDIIKYDEFINESVDSTENLDTDKQEIFDEIERVKDEEKQIQIHFKKYCDEFKKINHIKDLPFHRIFSAYSENVPPPLNRLKDFLSLSKDPLFTLLDSDTTFESLKAVTEYIMKYDIDIFETPKEKEEEFNYLNNPQTNPSSPFPIKIKRPHQSVKSKILLHKIAEVNRDIYQHPKEFFTDEFVIWSLRKNPLGLKHLKKIFKDKNIKFSDNVKKQIDDIIGANDFGLF